MFKHLYWRMTAKVLVAVMLAVLIAGGLGMLHVYDLLKTEFSTSVERVTESTLPSALQQIMTSSEEENLKTPQAEQAMNAYAGILKLDENRSCFLLSARDASVIAPASLQGASVGITKNLEDAMRGGKGNGMTLFGKTMDYALFIKNGNKVEDGYILYVRDNKANMNGALVQTAIRTLWVILAGFIFSLLAGLLVARDMMSPLRQLRRRVDRFAEGDFSPSLEKIPAGEMGELLRSFNRIGSVMSGSLNKINTEMHKVEVILENITSGIIAFDTNQRVVHINQAAKQMFRIENPEELRFDSFFRSLNKEFYMEEFAYLDQSKNEEQEILMEDKHIKAYLVPFKMDAERIAGVVCVFEDVTQQFNLETARQKFVAEVSHELKTPLTTIRSYTETLLNGYLDDKKTVANFLSIVVNEVDKMTAMVQNLLILNRFDTRNVEIQKELFSVDDLLREMTEVFSLEAEKKGMTLTYNRTTEIPEIYGDPDQIERAIKNIISNSIKYCSRGDKIQVFAGRLYNNVYIKVEDSGKGIPKSDIDHVFERFYRVDKARSREKGGTGLGLSITKEIIESHGGTIQIESEFGRFTRVTIDLPVPEE